MNNWHLVPMLFALLLEPALALAAEAGTEPSPDAQEPTLYTVGYAHLDTQWRWDYVKTIEEFLPNTLHDNFALFEKYPNYVFNFSGANRYRMLREYYPQDYARLKGYIASGRWFPCGSSMEECDVNCVSAESIIRQVLYGNHYFRREFGTASQEFMLPDCFGFPASLPSLLAHCGLQGFSTQKLTWGSAVGIPFNFGYWVGPDGSRLLCAFNPGSYGSQVTGDLSQSAEWLKRVQANGEQTGAATDYMYFGTGDFGGAPTPESVYWVERSVKGRGPLRVQSTKADQFFIDLAARTDLKLPECKGDLLLTQHSAGSITSQAYMKRWNRQNELLAGAAEGAAYTAGQLGSSPYPLRQLNDAWTLVMGGQFHDILPGTSTPHAYQLSWNDELLAQNQFADVLKTAVGQVAALLDTQTPGQAVVVYNPLNIEREGLVVAGVPLGDTAAVTSVKITAPDGAAVPAQVVGAGEGQVKLAFIAKVPGNGFAVYDVQLSADTDTTSELSVSENSLENHRYRVSLNADGDVASIFDKREQRELLAEPIRLAFTHDAPGYWPAWNIDWEDQSQPPYAYVGGPASVRIADSGQARVALEITREAEGSRFVQTVSLAAGESGERVEFHNVIDWRSTGCNLKAVFPLSVSNPLASYNWEAGTIQRGNNDEKQYEVPAHQWFDLTDSDGGYGVTVLCPFKYGSDKPDDNTLRLTLLRTPGPILNKNGSPSADYADQTSQDFGRHEISFGLAGHSGDWRQERSYWQGYEMEQPLLAFTAAKHDGVLGRRYSLCTLDSSSVRVLAFKQAEDSDELVLRLVELDGQPQPAVKLQFAAILAGARELNGQEQQVGALAFSSDSLALAFAPYQIRTIAVRFAVDDSAKAPSAQALALPYNISVASFNEQIAEEGFDGDRRCLPAEMLPRELASGGVPFTLAAGLAKQRNAVRCAGQSVELPGGDATRLYLLAAATPGDQTAEFSVDGQAQTLTIQDWGGFIGQWDTREWNTWATDLAFVWPFTLTGLRPGFVKPAPVAWFCSHRHNASGQNETYEYCYLYRYALELPAGARELKLPDNGKVVILAATLAQDIAANCQPAQPLNDTLADHTGIPLLLQ